MPLTEVQRQLVENNMGLVATVIKDCVRNPNNAGIFSYEDLYQYGCIGLCVAASTYRDGGRAKFDTYAYILIRNEIYKKLEYATLRNKREQSYEPEALPAIIPDAFGGSIHSDELLEILDKATANTSGITAKGIMAIKLQAQGYTCKEIGTYYGGVAANNVTAWISRARKYLRSLPEIKMLISQEGYTL